MPTIKLKEEEKESRDIVIRININLIIGITLGILLVYIIWTFLIMPMSLLIDSRFDRSYCRATASVLITEEMSDLVCYTNDDFNKLNFGKDIDCSCFYKGKYKFSYGDVEGIKSSEFKIK